METASISPAVGHHLANAGTAPTPSIRRREGGGADVWWPLSDADLYAAGLPAISWWKYRDTDGAGGVAEPQLLIGLHDGAQIELRRDSVSATSATPAAEVAMLALAHQRGWTAVTVAGDPATKERLARELLTQGVAVVNPELAQYCARVRAELATGDVITTGPAIPAQPAAPTATRSPRLNLFGWRQKREAVPTPVTSATPAQAEQPKTTGHQVQVDTAPPAPVVPTADELEGAAQRASQDDVDGVLSYRTRIDAYKLSELATDDQRMRAYYRSMLDADEKGYPWRGPAREALQALEREIRAGNLDEAHDKLYDAWLAMDSDELSLVRRYNERVDELREERQHDVRPS